MLEQSLKRPVVPPQPGQRPMMHVDIIKLANVGFELVKVDVELADSEEQRVRTLQDFVLKMKTIDKRIGQLKELGLVDTYDVCMFRAKVADAEIKLVKQKHAANDN